LELSKELLDIVLILLPGLISFVIAEALIPRNKAEFNRSIVYVIALSTLSFLLAISLWKFYYMLSNWIQFNPKITDLKYTDGIFSFHSSYMFTLVVFILAVIIGLFFAWAINHNLIYKLMNKLGASNMTSNMEVWDDFFATPRENSFVVVRDINNNLMYYGTIKYYSIGTTSRMVALHMTDLDVFQNDTAEKLYDINELYLPFHSDSMTVEFPNFTIHNQGENNE
jgi:hypothetical protein